MTRYTKGNPVIPFEIFKDKMWDRGAFTKNIGEVD